MSDFPSSSSLTFKSKFSTDLYILMKRKTYTLSATLSPNENYFSIFTKDKHVHIFKVSSAKAVRTINLGMSVVYFKPRN